MVIPLTEPAGVVVWFALALLIAQEYPGHHGDHGHCHWFVVGLVVVVVV